jgi:hypothetical protein
MKRFLLLLSLTFSVFLFAQMAQADIPPQGDIPDVAVPELTVTQATSLDGVFSTFLALVAFIPIAVQFLRKRLIPYAKGAWVQVFSWVVGIVITLVVRLLNLGFLDGLSIWLALLYGIGACLAANGVFDTGLITAVFVLFGKKANK